MAVDVYISVILREICEGKSRLSLEAETIGEVIEKIEAECPGFGGKVLTSEGLIQKSILVSLDGVKISAPSPTSTPVEPGAHVYFLVPLAGG